MSDDQQPGHTHETSCLNCGARLAGEYCHACGQKAHVHRTIGALWHDFLHSVLHIDGKFVRTIPLLALRPGELTHRYVHGERAKFVSPLALFLFSVFLTFAVFSALGAQMVGGVTGTGIVMTEEIADARGELATLERKRAAAIAAGKPTAELDRQIKSNRQSIAVMERLEGSAEEKPGAVDADLADAPAGLRYFDDAYRKAKANPSLLLYKLQANAYKFSWALIPLSVPLVWLLFLHRRRYRQAFTGFDHFVFVTYSIAFMSLVLILFVLATRTGLDFPIVKIVLLLVPPVHMYRQLRGAYGLSRFSAAWRAALLVVLATLALLLFTLLLLALGLFG